MIHLTSGRSLAGTLWSSRRGVLELRGALELVGRQQVPLDGSVCIPQASVDFFQHGLELPDHAVRVAA